MKPRFRSYDPFSTVEPVARRPHPPQTVARVAPSRNSQETLLERRYPAIARAVTLLWGYPELNDYFSKLWLADGNAEPIDPEVMADLMLLARIHQHLVQPKPVRTLSTIYGRDYEMLRKPDPWEGVTSPRRG